ncbi:tetratricopeptide repeat protein [Mucilaginibacter psychrotolerans]|uniref:Tetratricopeptide repeat protein n=1 Tax=Mucilaginibacter psychrotolerans TaxID=1524096 RepID=A0A4Y8S652_9SPHI|nr:hypothetical protein [Mucilaginibacter psychrotolerans]TFF34499.1 hypothetical protein E2R66_22055 [Mucilaginibacter psychrotolerans]
MAGIKYLLIIVLVITCCLAKAQTDSYQKADSTSYALYLAGNWPQLISYGEAAISNNTDFPLLRLRIAYARFITGNYGAALNQYQQILKHDSHSQAANYYAYLCNLYLNRDDMAAYHLTFVHDTTFSARPSSVKVLSITAEHGFRSSSNYFRGNGNYTRIGLATQLGHKLSLDQSFIHFGQGITFLDQYRLVNNPVKQFEYYSKLNYALNNKLAIFGAYHYLNTKYSNSTFNNSIGIAGVKYSTAYAVLQADASTGTIGTTQVQQYNAQLSFYPAGNLNFYTVSRGSLLRQGKTNFAFSQTLGAKIINHFWLEGNATLGTLDDYLDNDGLYVYNAIDIIKFKTGGTGYYQLNNHILLYVNYTFEQKNDYYRNANYNLHSVTGGLTWKF